MGIENDIDQLFKRGLDEPEIPFNELDWEKMERKLDENKKRKIIPFRVFTASGIAAALLIFLFWFFSGPSVPKNEVNSQLTEQKGKTGMENKLPGSEADTVKIKQPGLSHENITGTQGTAGSRDHQELWAGDGQPQVADAVALAAIAKDHTGISPLIPLVAAPVYVSSAPFRAAVPERTAVPAKAPQRTAAPLTDSAILAQKAMALALSKDPLEKINRNDITKSVQKKMDGALSQRPNLILSAMAAPDISSGPSSTSRSSKVSTNLGVLATYALGSKFSLTSGAIYAKKYYNYSANPGGSSTYTPPAGTDLEVKADCNVIDIPVNVNYKVLDKKKFSVSVNTGLSSYFMLKEKYDYIIDRPDQPQLVTTTEINNKNQHVFGIANVSVSLDHQISRRVSVGVQPFAKLPLTGIGNYDVNLKSTGVSFSLNIGLFPAKKPGKLAANRYSSLY